jgi:hypothetical protein
LGAEYRRVAAEVHRALAAVSGFLKFVFIPSHEAFG